MKKFLSRLVLLSALSVAALPALAQDFRVGAVSLDRILRDSNPAKAATAKLEQEFSRREREIETLGNQLKTASERFEREAPTMSEGQRNNLQRQLVEQDREFQRKRREFQEDLAIRRNEELQTVIERANRVIRQVAEAEKFDLVIQEWVYVNPKHDITDKVINGLNSGR